MKIYALPPHEDWIVDRLVDEWKSWNSDVSTGDMETADIIWLLADWCWQKIPHNLLKSKKVVTTVHHIVPEKFDVNDFSERDKITNVYHVPNFRTRDFIQRFTSKPIYVIPYWANQELWFPSTMSKNEIRKKYNIPTNKFVIGSFQRDSEGFDTNQPKNEKGPRELAEYIATQSEIKKDVAFVVGGWRRHYVIKTLDSLCKERGTIVEICPCDIEHKHAGNFLVGFEQDSIGRYQTQKIDRRLRDCLTTQTDLCELYQTLDVYAITAKYEGGPQAFIECGLVGTPVVSTPVGIAEVVLSAAAINVDVTKAIPEIPNVYDLQLPQGFVPYRRLFEMTLQGLVP